MAESYAAIVIGAGEAGMEVAGRVVEAGGQVAVIYRPPYGSVCLNAGCVPSKFLIHRARVAHLIRTAERFHIQTTSPRVNLAALIREKTELVNESRTAAYQSALETEQLTLVEGAARFLSPREIQVGERRLQAEKIFIATGMRPRIPPIEGLDTVPYTTSDTIMDGEELPEHLIVIGGGYIGCELGQTFSRFGSAVTILQSGAQLCPEEEPELSRVLEHALQHEGLGVILGHRVVRVQRADGGIQVVARAQDGQEQVVTGSHLLVAAGRQPNTDTLELFNAGVALDERGFVRVNAALETTTPGIWAIGDVNGQQPFTRVCQEEGKIAYANAFEGAGLQIERQSLGHAIFTDPELAGVGLREDEARAQGYEIIAGHVPFAQISKARLIGEPTGRIKYIVDKPTLRLLGCHIIGAAAADLIFDAAMIIRHGGTIKDLAMTVGVFPTLQEGMEGAARALLASVGDQDVEGPLVSAPAADAQHGHHVH